MGKSKKYIVRGIAIAVGLLLLYWAGMFIFFSIKKEFIRQKLSSEISRVIRGDFEIKDLGVNFFSTFPNIALSMRNVEMKDSMWTSHHVSLLKAKKLLLRINPFSLIGGEVSVSKIVLEDATIHAFTDSLGYTNEYLFSPKSQAKNDGAKKKKNGFHLEEIAMKNVHIIRSDVTKRKMYDIDFKKLKFDLQDFGTGYLVDVNLDSRVHQLAFNTNKGSFLQEKPVSGEFSLVFDTAARSLQFEKVKLLAGRQHLVLSGKFNFANDRNFNLTVLGNGIQYAQTIELLPEKLRKKLVEYDVDQPMNVTANISGKLSFGQQTKVIVNANCKNVKVNSPAGYFNKASFAATFSNALVDSLPWVDENSGLLFTNLTADWEGVQLKCNRTEINNLANPLLRTDLQASTDLKSLNNLLSSNSFDFHSGQLTTNVHYSGSLFSDTATTITGEINLEKGVIEYAPRQLTLSDIHGRFEFNGNDVLIKDLAAGVEGNSININAAVKNMVNILSSDPSKFFVDATVTSPFIDLRAFRTMVGSRRKTRSAARGKFARIADRIDRFMETCSINTHLKANKLQYKNFVANDVNANFSMNADAWNIREVSLDHGSGSIDISGTLTAKERNYNLATLLVNMKNVDVSKVFSSFNNFGLASLHAENLRGKLNSRMKINAVLDDESTLLPALMEGTIFLSLKDGELIDFEPLQKMSVFVLKKRDFSHLQFAELKDSFNIKGSLLTIHKMEIQSNVLGLLVEGIYDINQKGTDLVVQVPLKYLKKRDPGYVPSNDGLDAKRGISIYVRARNGNNGDIDFKYGIFKKKSILEKNQKKSNSIP